MTEILDAKEMVIFINALSSEAIKFKALAILLARKGIIDKGISGRNQEVIDYLTT